MEKLLEDASIKLSAVASSVTTVSAREMLAQLVAGNRDAAAMAELGHGKMRSKRVDLVEALTGHFDDHHALLVGAMLHRLDHVETALAELDATIAAAMTPWAHHQVRAAADHLRRGPEDGAGHHRRDRWWHGAVPVVRTAGGVGWARAGHARVGRPRCAGC